MVEKVDSFTSFQLALSCRYLCFVSHSHCAVGVRIVVDFCIYLVAFTAMFFGGLKYLNLMCLLDK